MGTIERTNILSSDTVTMVTTSVPIEDTIQGSGYVYSINLDVNAPASGNSASVAYAEDAPFNSISSLIFEDVNGQLINVDGYSMFLANLAERGYAYRYLDQGEYYNAGTTGTGSTGGTFRFQLDVPIGLNRRSLTGIVGNQSQAQKYGLRNDLNASGQIYTTPPTTLPVVTISKVYENYSVPQGVTSRGVPQAEFPDDYGTLHYITKSVNASVPIGGGTVNHYLSRIGKTIRFMILVFRANGSRSTANTNAPTQIQLTIGDVMQFNETYLYRRNLMYKRYGFTFPNGVLVYDAIHDFDSGAGDEIGDDYWHTQAVTQAQFQITYPSGFGSTNNSLTVITDDLDYVNPATLNPAAAAG